MAGLQTSARELHDSDVRVLVRCAAVVLIGAAYQLYDRAIAETLERDIKFTNNVRGLPTVEDLHKYQRALPRMEAPITEDWVAWAASTRDNWGWMMLRYKALAHSYTMRFGGRAPGSAEVNKLWMHGPRPRPAGRTPFPEEPC